ncbi:MAG: pirin family protein [Euryarchaeota archaeon]|nr:pirin family protein [Euryarchaeota archaeon]
MAAAKKPTRPVAEILPARAAIEGAGVRLKRAFGHDQVPRLDPFLLLDDFRSQNPLDYVAGFPWHPHRGMETVTYMLDGRVDHEDSMGNKGTIGAGDVQWMTAGSGIVHQEMPRPASGTGMGGFQLWVNLPARKKMMPPRYQEIKAPEIPIIATPEKRARVIAGELAGVKGPVRDIVVDPSYLDVTLGPGATFEHAIPKSHTTLAYVLEGSVDFGEGKESVVPQEHLAILGAGDTVRATARPRPTRFLLVSGKPLGEPVAWWGPIVMNTKREIETALEEYREGTFIKETGSGASRPRRT